MNVKCLIPKDRNDRLKERQTTLKDLLQTGGRMGAILGVLWLAALPVQAWDFYATMDPGSTAGDLHGTLILSFSNQNPSDWNPHSGIYAPGSWTSMGLDQTLTDPLSSDAVTLGLLAIPDVPPGELYVYGGMSLSVPGFYSADVAGIGGPGGDFLPGQPLDTQSGGQGSGEILSTDHQELLDYTLGFSLDMPWNGTSADCTGTWWADYTLTLVDPPTSVDPAPEPSSGTLILLAVGLAGMFALKRVQREVC